MFKKIFFLIFTTIHININSNTLAEIKTINGKEVLIVDNYHFRHWLQKEFDSRQSNEQHTQEPNEEDAWEDYELVNLD